MRGDLGALVGTDALAPFARRAAYTSSHTPGPMINAKPTSTTAAPITPPRSARHESTLTKNAREPGRDARRARDDPRERRRAACRTSTRDRVGRRRAAGARGTASRVARRAVSRGRVESIARPTIAAPNGHTITSPGHGPTARTSSSRPSTTAANAIVETASVRRGGEVGIARAHEQPARAVEHRADPARERQHEEPAAHDVGVDAERVAEPGRDTRDDATRRAGGRSRLRGRDQAG